MLNLTYEKYKFKGIFLMLTWLSLGKANFQVWLLDHFQLLFICDIKRLQEVPLMIQLQSVSTHFKPFFSFQTVDFYCTIRINISKAKRSHPFRTKLSCHFESRIVKEDFLSNFKLFWCYHPVMERFCPFLVSLGIFKGFLYKLLKLLQLRKSTFTGHLQIPIAFSMAK